MTEYSSLERKFLDSRIQWLRKRMDAERARAPGRPPRAAVDAALGPQAHHAEYDIRTESGRYIFEEILPGLLEYFFAKNAGYGDQHRYGLGPAAEWVGIDRKIHKLERVLWDGEAPEPGQETTEQMLFDLVGQVLIILDLLAGNHNPRGRGPSE